MLAVTPEKRQAWLSFSFINEGTLPRQEAHLGVVPPLCSIPSKTNQQPFAQTPDTQTVNKRFSSPYLFQLFLHPRCQHNAGNSRAKEEEEGIDEARHGGVLAVGTASAQQAGGTAAQTGNLKKHKR